MNLLEKFSKITTLVFDMDGVLTDGSLLIMPEGVMARRMNVKDGYALQLAVKKGYKVIVVSGSYSKEATERLYKLGITEVFMQVIGKLSLLQQYVNDAGLSWEEILFMGDDIPDVEVLGKSGLPCCPADAVMEVREKSLYISPLNGGYGCVRDVIEKVMRTRGHWSEDTNIPST
jgi:3-deoxy-D-manno-octulosonate 8-phosphate phosphatase (KDO 8-P phosphatase)